MALLDEQLVEEWLNRNRFFTMRGLKCGVDEIDLLALRYDNGIPEYLHVEVQVSYRPIGYIGGDANARLRTVDEVKAGVTQWVNKKFTSDRKTQKRNSIIPNANWRYMLVHGVLRDETELDYMRELGVELTPYKTVLEYLRDNTNLQSSSIASNITDILTYMRN